MDSQAWNFITGQPIPMVVLPKGVFDEDSQINKYFMKSRVGTLQNRWDKKFVKRINLKIEEDPRSGPSSIDITELAMV